MHYKAIKTKLKLNNLGSTLMAKHAGFSRWVYKGSLPLEVCRGIGIEDLNVSGMKAFHKFAKAIQDMSFFEFRRQLTYKCELYGSELVVVDQWFPSSKSCSYCGIKKETLTLKQRVFECSHCGTKSDRDLNASINLEKAVS